MPDPTTAPALPCAGCSPDIATASADDAPPPVPAATQSMLEMRYSTAQPEENIAPLPDSFDLSWLVIGLVIGWVLLAKRHHS